MQPTKPHPAIPAAEGSAAACAATPPERGDRLIIRADLARVLGVKSSQTMRRYVAQGKLPPPDKVLSPHAQYWLESTLCKAGIPVPPLDDDGYRPPSLTKATGTAGQGD